MERIETIAAHLSANPVTGEFLCGVFALTEFADNKCRHWRYSQEPAALTPVVGNNFLGFVYFLYVWGVFPERAGKRY